MHACIYAFVCARERKRERKKEKKKERKRERERERERERKREKDDLEGLREIIRIQLAKLPRIPAHARTRTHTHAHARTRTHTHAHARTRTSAPTHTYRKESERESACASVCVRKVLTHTHIHTYTQTLGVPLFKDLSSRVCARRECGTIALAGGRERERESARAHARGRERGSERERCIPQHSSRLSDGLSIVDVQVRQLSEGSLRLERFPVGKVDSHVFELHPANLESQAYLLLATGC
jgi:hypothetical protein